MYLASFISQVVQIRVLLLLLLTLSLLDKNNDWDACGDSNKLWVVGWVEFVLVIEVGGIS